MSTATAAARPAAGVRGKRNGNGAVKNGRPAIQVPDKAIEVIRTAVVKEKKQDGEVLKLLKTKGVNISLWKLRELRKNILGLAKPGGYVQKRGGKKRKKAKAAKRKARKGTARQRKRARKNGDPLKDNLRAAIVALNKRERSLRKQAKRLTTEAKSVAKQAAEIRRILRT